MAGRSLFNDYKEQALRQAQAWLEHALAAYPPVYARALRAKGHALALSADSARPRGLVRMVWPTLGTVAAAETAKRYGEWAASCATDASNVEAEFALAVDDEDRADLGRRLVASDLEPAFSADAHRVRMEIRRASEAVRVELGKLGRLA